MPSNIKTSYNADKSIITFTVDSDKYVNEFTFNLTATNNDEVSNSIPIVVNLSPTSISMTIIGGKADGKLLLKNDFVTARYTVIHPNGNTV
jgi:hypothetical protein